MNKKQVIKGMLMTMGISIILNSTISSGAYVDVTKNDNMFIRGFVAALEGIENTDVSADNWEYIVNNDNESLTITGYKGTAENVVMPESINGKNVTKIVGDFINADSTITSIEIPAFVTEITSSISESNPNVYFANATNLKEIKVSKYSVTFTAENGVLYNKDKTKLLRYPPAKDGENFGVDSTVTAINDYAFYGCNKLKLIGLDFIKSNGESNSTVSDTTNAAYYWFVHATVNTENPITSNITTIGKYAFSNCSNLESIFTPKTVERIEERIIFRLLKIRGCLHFFRSNNN